MAVLDDAASIKRLKAVFQEHLDKHDADIGLTSYADDGISAAPNQLYTTPAPAPVGPPAQAYAGGGKIERAAKQLIMPFAKKTDKLNGLQKWLGDSEAVDDKGLPLTLYHASPNDFEKFETGRPTRYSTTLGSYDSSVAASFFAEHPDLADFYARNAAGVYKPGSSIYPVHIRAQNPADLREGIQWDLYDALKNKTDFNPKSLYHMGPTDMWGAFEQENGGDHFVEALKSLGHDSARLTEFHPEGLPNQNSWATFDPSQVKSPFNRGSFDPADPRIGYASGGEVSPYTRFTEDGDRTADAWARYAPKGEYQSYDYLPRFADPTDLARGVVDAAKGIGQDFADSGYNPARYLIHGADRFGQNYLGGITPQDVADMAVPHDLGDQYGLSGRVADALSTVMPGVGSLAIPPLYEGARYVADKYLPKFGEGGQVSKNLLKMFHGTGRTFDKFDPTMIERGGGTRTYGAGYGHYFTEDPIYAENYHGYGSTPTTLGVTLDQAPNSLLDLDRYMSKTPRLVDRLKGVGSPDAWRGFDWDKKGRSALAQLTNHYGDEEAARRLVSKDFTGTVFDNEFGHGRNIATFPGQEDRIGIVDRHTGTALDDLRNKWYGGLDAADKITPAPMYPNENPQIQYGNIAYAEGGRVSRLIKQIANTRGAFQGERATKAADLANLDRISSNGVLDLFDSDKSSLLTAMPPSKFEDYATRLPLTARGVVPYPRFENYPGRSMPRWQDQTYDNYLDKLAQSMKTGPQDRRAYAPGELWMYKNPEDMTEIEGHEGRHRMAALARLGDESGLVHLRPVNPGELNMRPDMEERISDLKQKYFPQGADTPIVPQFTLQSRYNFKGEPQMGKFDITNRDALPLPATPFGEGGKVLSQVIREIAGKPSSIKIAGEGAVGAYPIREFEDVAKKFSSRYGNDYPINAYPKFDEDKARKIAEAYDAMKHDPTDPRVKRSYDALVDETMDQYRALKDTGARFEFLKPGEADPYAKTPSLGYLDLVRNGRLKVFPTEQGYGTQTDISDNPLLKRVGRVGDLDNATANDAFRVVHDALGHFGPGNPFFRAPGEERAWYAHSHSYSPDALPAATSELRGQNSWVNYGPHGEANRSASGADTVYADQKAGLLPEWAYKYREGGKVLSGLPKFGEGGKVIQRITNAIRAYHGSPHDFDKFDASKIGTGEGNQSFGHGLYFAGNEGVARDYRDRLSGRLPEGWMQDIPSDASPYVRGIIGEIATQGLDPSRAATLVQRANISMRDRPGEGLADWLRRSAEATKGHMYEVGIHADPSRFLGWDRSIPEDAWHRIDPNVRGAIDDALDARGMNPMSEALDDYQGSHLYQALRHHDVQDTLPPTLGTSDWISGNTDAHRHTAEYLRSLDIPGISYLDGQSRKAGAGTSNYVMFPGTEGLIDITRKYADGGSVEDFFNEFQAMNYRKGGPARDFANLYQSQYFDDGGDVLPLRPHRRRFRG